MARPTKHSSFPTMSAHRARSYVPSWNRCLHALLAALTLDFVATPTAWAQNADKSPEASAEVSAQETQRLGEVKVFGRSLRPGDEKAGIGLLADQAIATVPMSISILRAAQLRDAGAGGLSNAMRGETSVSDAYNTLGFIESLQIRGFLLSNQLNYQRDGLPTSNYAPIAFENKEAIEILKGAAGLQMGEGAPGGGVNYVVKRPTAKPLQEVFYGLSERGSQLLHTDLGNTIRAEDGRPLWGYRVNLALEQRRPMVDHAPGARRFASAALQLPLPRDVVVSAEFEMNHSRQVSVPGWSLVDRNQDGVAESVPPVPPARANLNAQPWTQPFVSSSWLGSVGLEQRLQEEGRWGLRISRQRIRTDDRIAFPDGCGSVYPGMCADGSMDLYDYRSDHEIRQLSNAQVYWRDQRRIGAALHSLSASLLSSRYQEDLQPMQAYNWVGQINVWAPTALPGDGSLSTLNALQRSQTTQWVFGDVIQWNSQWSTWLGARHTRLDRRSQKTDGQQATAYDQSFTTPYAAVSYQWDRALTTYLSYSEGVESEVVPNRPDVFSNAGQVLAAAKSRQWELGLKQKLADAGLLTVAAFNIEKSMSSDVADPSLADHSLRLADGRRARHRGLELAWSGRPLPSLAPTLNSQLQMTYIDAVTVAATDSALIGKRTPNVPKFTASWFLVYGLPGLEGVSWSNRVNYSGSRAITTENIASIPAFYQWDTGLSWRFRQANQTWTLRAGIDNVTDHRYWKDAPTQYWGGTYLFPAPPRTYRLSAQLNF